MQDILITDLASFFSDVLCNEIHPVGQILDFFYKIEFQQRGSPHVYMLLWIKDSPNIVTHGKKDIEDFINKNVTCNKDGADSSLVKYQTHRHAKTCMKKKQYVGSIFLFHQCYTLLSFHL